MLRFSRLLSLAGTVLIIGGVALLLLAAAIPATAPPVPPTLMPFDIPTPTPGYLSTPLQPPQIPLDVPPEAGEIALVLPVMPVDRVEAPGDGAASPTPVILVTATASSTRPAAVSTPAEESPAAPEQRATATAEPTTSPPVTVPDRIVIPRLEVDAPVEPVGWETITLDEETFGQWEVPDGFAAGWHDTSAPLGQPGNTVLNGHHNVNGEVFGDLIALEPGDDLTLWSGEQAFAYVVAQTMVLQERHRTAQQRLENARWILPSDDERVTLVTCWPRNSNTHRLIVVAVPKPDSS